MRSLLGQARAARGVANASRRRLAIATAIAVSSCCAVSFAATRNWTNNANDYSWSNASNWSPFGVPVQSDDVFIDGSTQLTSRVSYNYTGPALTLSSLHVSHSNSTVLLNTSELGIGGNYTLSAYSEYVGDSSNGGSKGRGQIDQSGGYNSGGNVVLGNLATDLGTYNLSGGYLFGTAIVGNSGAGVITQTGGSLGQYGGTTAIFYLGRSGGSGTYNLQQGYINSDFECVGYDTGVPNSGTGQFIQTGGTNDDSHGSMYIGTQGSYSLSGDSALTARYETIYGTFDHSAGNNTLGQSGDGPGGITLTTGTYDLGQTATLYDNGYLVVGQSNGDVANFNQTGGSNRVTQNLTLGRDAGSTGTYTMSGGTMEIDGGLTVGGSGSGTFNNTGGEQDLFQTVFSVGATGAYHLSGSGVLNTHAGETIYGTFDQTAGTHTASSDPSALAGMNVTGSYHLGGGTLSADLLAVETNGSFVQDGGIATIGTSGQHTVLAVIGSGDPNAPATATYTLGSGASLTVHGALHVGGLTLSSNGVSISQPVGAGVFNMSGGNLTVTDFIKVWDATGNAFNFSGGTITTPGIQGDASRFNWTGGTLNISDPDGVFIGAGGTIQNVTLNTGMVLNANALTLTTGGTFTPNGGTADYSGPLVLKGGTLATSSLGYSNTAQITGYGTIAGSGNFTNAGAISVPTGSLSFAGTGTNTSFGVINLSGGTSLHLTGSGLINTGTINISGGVLIDGTSPLHNNAGGLITGSGFITADLENDGGTLMPADGVLSTNNGFANFGTIQLTPGGTLGGWVENHGRIQGSGNVTASVDNSIGVIAPLGAMTISGPLLLEHDGAISLATGGLLRVTGTISPNGGTISLTGGELDTNSQVLSNSTSAQIAGHGTLRTGGIVNDGSITLTGGPGDVYGDLTNHAGALVLVTGGSHASFYNNVTLDSDSEFRISPESVAVFLGSVNGASTFTGSGTKIFEGGTPSAIAALDTSGQTQVLQGASLTTGHVRENSLTVEGHVTITPDGSASGVSRVQTLEIRSGGILDLTNNKLIVADVNQTGTWDGTRYTGISGLVQIARANGWTGTTGITSSTAAGAANQKLYSIGVAKAGDVKGISDSQTSTFAGQTVLGSDTIAMFTYAGDANLDGKINIDDYGLIDSHVGQSGSVFGWHDGDFNYDGKINIDDYGIIDGNIGAQGAPIPTAQADGSIAGVSAVPEPGAGALLVGFFAPGILRRRRRSDSGV